MEALKEGWAAKLRRQRRDWAAAEEARRGAWVVQKTRDIKELTAKVSAAMLLAFLLGTIQHMHGSNAWEC